MRVKNCEKKFCETMISHKFVSSDSVACHTLTCSMMFRGTNTCSVVPLPFIHPSCSFLLERVIDFTSYPYR